MPTNLRRRQCHPSPPPINAISAAIPAKTTAKSPETSPQSRSDSARPLSKVEAPVRQGPPPLTTKHPLMRFDVPCPRGRGDRVRPRDFITLLGGAATWPLAARAQQPVMPVIGFLGFGSFDTFALYLAALRRSLGEIGFVEGQNVAIEYRWAEGQYDRMPQLAAELVRRRVAIIAMPGSPPAAVRAVKAANTVIPIVFSVGGDGRQVRPRRESRRARRFFQYPEGAARIADDAPCDSGNLCSA